MSNTALAVRTEAMAPRDLAEARDFARLVSSSSLLPATLRNKPEDVFVIVVSGHELGLSPMQAIRSISVIQGKPVLDAALMVALVKRNRDVCEYFSLVESTPQRATYATKRTGEPAETRITYTIEEAKTAGLVDKDNWRRHAPAMLRARASAALARAVYPDLVLGVYETDEGEEMREAAPVRQFARPEQVEDAVTEPSSSPPRRLTTEDVLKATREMGDVARSHEGMPNRAAPTSDTEVKLEFSILHARMNKLPGMGGDENKEKRRQFWAGALGYKDVGPRWSPFTPFAKADAATKQRVADELAKLEAAAHDAMPDFTQVEQDGRQPGEEG